jgi:hypothetical protein
MSVTGKARELVEAFVALDVRATSDPNNVQPPCVVVAPNGFTFDHLGADCLTYRFNLYAVAPGARLADSLPTLDTLVEAVRQVVDIKDVRPASYPFGEGELPAYMIPVELDGEW